jgi:deoxyadenosine/deoxycytidine kinase
MNKSAILKLKTKKIYSIEGNIGAGKTTILNIIGQHFDDVTFVEEPVSQWQNLGGENLLEKFYQDPERWGFTFEFYSMFSKLKCLMKAADSEKNIIIIERSILSNKIFIDLSKEMNKLNDLEYGMLINTYNFYMQNIYPMLNGIIYLNTPVDLCVQRIIQRNRGEEVNVDKNYLLMLKDKFDELSNYSTIPTLVIDGNFDLERDSTKVGIEIHNFMSPNSSSKAIII